MSRPSPAFNDNESAILLAIYEDPDVSHSSYTLNQKLNPTVKEITSLDDEASAYGTAFADTGEAIEELIVRGLIRGKRSKGADGIYWDDLKLTNKGEQAAIQERRRVAQFKKESPELDKQADALAPVIRKFQKQK